MIDILKFTIPSLVVLLSVWIVMRYLLRGEEERRLWEMKKNTEKEVTPIRLRAYERLALLLERTEPEQLLSDLNLTQMTKAELEQRLLLNVKPRAVFARGRFYGKVAVNVFQLFHRKAPFLRIIAQNGSNR